MKFELLILHLHFIDLYIMTDIMNLLGVELRVIIGHFRKRLLLQLRCFNVLARALVVLVGVSVVSTWIDCIPCRGLLITLLEEATLYGYHHSRIVDGRFVDLMFVILTDSVRMGLSSRAWRRLNVDTGEKMPVAMAR